MNAWQSAIAASLFIDVLLAFAVFLTNTKRTVNRHFVTLSVAAGAWVACMGWGSLAADRLALMYWIRVTSMVAPLVMTAFNLLRLSLIYPDDSWFQIVRRAYRWLFLNMLAALLCTTDFFLTDATPPHGHDIVGMPVYGPGFILYTAYWVMTAAALLALSIRDVRRLTGIQRVELQFSLLGYGVGLCVGILVVLVIPLLTGNIQPGVLAPLSVVFMDAVIAYGVATRRIMGVEDALSRIFSYGLLVVYMAGVYLGVWWVARHAIFLLHLRGVTFVPNLLAAIAIALSTTFAQGSIRRWANRLFVGTQGLDAGKTIQKAHQILRSLGTLDVILERFALTVSGAVGAERVVLLLLDGDGYVERYPAGHGSPPLTIAPDDPIVTALRRASSPAVLDLIRRTRPTLPLMELEERLRALEAHVAVPIRSRERLEGIMLMGPRALGRIYGITEQDTLSLLCDQLAVALENAKLYTQVQESKLYDELLLDQLVSGVVAADARGTVTVFNREALHMTGLSPDAVLNQPIASLPDALAVPLRQTFTSRREIRDHESLLPRASGPSMPVRLSSAVFHGNDNRFLGVLLVFNDLTALRSLEMQVRRNDRLASLGTLSAGMAHEIKNPLVTIKTFAQHLPERYEDTDIRQKFSELVGHEVRRIDDIVTQLLSFAKPVQPEFAPTHVHEVVTDSLRLVEEQLRQKSIVRFESFSNDSDLIQGDAELLKQVFINIFLNAVEAMAPQGELRIATDVRVHQVPSGGDPSAPRRARRCIRVSIGDTGEGISPEILAHVFDPFFTTKSSGTGLGLAVAHGIVTEHGGGIDAESQLGEGSTFHVVLPLHSPEEAA